VRRACILLALILVCLCTAGVAARAQEDGQEEKQAPGYRPAPEEQALIDLFTKQGKPIAGSEAARAYLQKHPDSFVACNALGWYYLAEDGDLPRAYFYLTRARKILERDYEGRWTPDSPYRFYSSTLIGLYLTNEHMERYEEAIRTLDVFNEHFTKKRYANYAWPLMKLGRTGEARAKIAQALAGQDKDQQVAALNVLASIEGEDNDVEESYKTFTELYERLKASGEKVHVTEVRNLGNTAIRLLRFDEAEQRFLEAAKNFDPDQVSNPWHDLANLYVEEGRLPEAVDAVKRMQEWAYRSLPVMAQNNWNSRQTMAACLLYYCGYTEEALRLAEQVVYRPDRHGMGSAGSDLWQASSFLFYRAVLLDRAERLREEMSWSRPVAWPGLALERAGVLARAWSVERQAGRLIMTNGWLGDTLRYVGAKSVVTFSGGEIQAIASVGPGVAEAEARRLLARTDPGADRERPFLLLFLGASQLGRSDARAALGNLRQAQATLPRATRNPLNQAIALEALACRELGDGAGEARALALLMESDPGMVRRFGLSLPAVISGSGGTAAEKAAAVLRRSPRLEPGTTGYRAVVEQTSTGALQGGLDAPDGSVLCRFRVNPGKDADATAREFCRQFHRKVFAPRLDLSQPEINSLEGSTLASQDASEQLKGLLGPSSDERKDSPAP
jgi:tetratricopeptide (TPR) repeat protein